MIHTCTQKLITQEIYRFIFTKKHGFYRVVTQPHSGPQPQALYMHGATDSLYQDIFSFDFYV